MIKWAVKDVIEAFEKAIKSSPNQGGNNQLLQQLLGKKGQQLPNEEIISAPSRR